MTVKKIKKDGVLHDLGAKAENVEYSGNIAGATNAKEAIDALAEGASGVDVSKRGYFGLNYPDQMLKIVDMDKKDGCLRFIQVTDTHDTGNTVSHFNTLEEDGLLKNSEADFLVHTGDIVKDDFWDTTAWPAKLSEETKPCYIVLGNHDCVESTKTSSSGSTGGRTPAQALRARYEKYFLVDGEPWIDADEVDDTNSQGKTYYHVDFTKGQNKFRCLFLDPTDNGTVSGAASQPNQDGYGYTDNTTSFSSYPVMSATQKVWFIEQLQDAAKNGYHVLIFVHVKPGMIDDPQLALKTINGVTNPNYIEDHTLRDGSRRASGWFTTLRADSRDFLETPFVGKFLLDTVNAFMEGTHVEFNDTTYRFHANGRFVGWFCGHTHWDNYGWSYDYPNQFFAVSSKVWPNHDEDDADKSQNPKAHVRYITIDADQRKVTIFNVGNQMLAGGEKRTIFTYNYE